MKKRTGEKMERRQKRWDVNRIGERKTTEIEGKK